MHGLRRLLGLGFSTVAAALLGIGCGSPANNSGLFATSGGTSPGAASGGGASESTGGSASPNAGSSAAGSVATGGSAHLGAGGTAGANSEAGTGGEPAGGAGSGGAPSAGAPSGGGGAGGSPTGGSGVGGGMLSDCSAFGADAELYSETKHCYLVVRDLATFAEAKNHCTSLGAHLVTLSSQSENDFVWSLDTNEHWIGATDGKGAKETTPGSYAWTDGEPFTYTDWSKGQPNASPSTCSDSNGGGMCYEHCGFQWSGGDVPGQWNDRLCAHTIEAVCEWDG